MSTPWIQDKAGASLNPAQVAHTLEQMSAGWPMDAPPLRETVEQFPLGEASLLHLISISSICAARLVRYPKTFLWLSDPNICAAARGHGEMLASMQEIEGDSISAENFRALRFWKGREMLRIALREVAETAPLEETTLELSLLAEI